MGNLPASASTPARLASASGPSTPQQHTRSATTNSPIQAGVPFPSSPAQQQQLPFPPSTAPQLPPSLPQSRSVMDKLADALLGVSPEESNPYNKYALICASCFAHNGLVPKDQFDFVRTSFALYQSHPTPVIELKGGLIVQNIVVHIAAISILENENRLIPSLILVIDESNRCMLLHHFDRSLNQATNHSHLQKDYRKCQRLIRKKRRRRSRGKLCWMRERVGVVLRGGVGNLQGEERGGLRE